MRKLFYLIAIATTVFISCGKQESETDDRIMSVNEVDESLLAVSVIIEEIGIKFSPPVGWENLDESVMKGLFADDTNEQFSIFNARPIKIFIHDNSGSYCVVSRLDLKKEIITRDMRVNAETYIEDLKEHFIVTDDDKNYILLINEFNASVFNIVDKDIVLYKLIFYTQVGQAFMVDYIIPSVSFNQNLLSMIEASISSVSQTNV